MRKAHFELVTRMYSPARQLTHTRNENVGVKTIWKKWFKPRLQAQVHIQIQQPEQILEIKEKERQLQVTVWIESSPILYQWLTSNAGLGTFLLQIVRNASSNVQVHYKYFIVNDNGEVAHGLLAELESLSIVKGGSFGQQLHSVRSLLITACEQLAERGMLCRGKCHLRKVFDMIVNESNGTPSRGIKKLHVVISTGRYFTVDARETDSARLRQLEQRFNKYTGDSPLWFVLVDGLADEHLAGTYNHYLTQTLNGAFLALFDTQNKMPEPSVLHHLVKIHIREQLASRCILELTLDRTLVNDVTVVNPSIKPLRNDNHVGEQHLIKRYLLPASDAVSYPLVTKILVHLNEQSLDETAIRPIKQIKISTLDSHHEWVSNPRDVPELVHVQVTEEIAQEHNAIIDLVFAAQDARTKLEELKDRLNYWDETLSPEITQQSASDYPQTLLDEHQQEILHKQVQLFEALEGYSDEPNKRPETEEERIEALRSEMETIIAEFTSNITSYVESLIWSIFVDHVASTSASMDTELGKDTQEVSRSAPAQQLEVLLDTADKKKSMDETDESQDEDLRDLLDF